MKNLYIRDVRSPWGGALRSAATCRGWMACSIQSPEDIDDEGYGFIRPHTNPRRFGRDKALAASMADRLTMVQDSTQIQVYDDKLAQARLWAKWMPQTWIFEDVESALSFAESAQLPLISKATQGASSQNVRLIEGRRSLVEHIRQAFGGGIPIRHCSGDGAKGRQRGYLLLQQFVPHQVTYRVNAVGRQRAVFFRNCYPDRPMAQTGNVRPAYGPEDAPGGLLDFAESFFAYTGTQWCALDILRDGDQWRLLETSLAWPHPSPGDCNDARFWPSGRRWEDMWGVLLDELESWH